MPKQPDLSGHPEWEPLVLPSVLTDLKSFVSGEPEGDRFRIKYYYDPQSLHIQSRVWFGPRTAGPPGHAHGGSMAAVLDEAMGVAAVFAGHIALAGQLTINFSNMLPLEEVVTAEAWVKHVDGTKIQTQGVLKSNDGITYASSEGLFIEIGYERFSKLVGS